MIPSKQPVEACDLEGRDGDVKMMEVWIVARLPQPAALEAVKNCITGKANEREEAEGRWRGVTGRNMCIRKFDESPYLS